MEILVISGLSGAGKSSAATYLEDMGYYTVDNMPADIILKFAEFCAQSDGRYDRVAFVSDIRSGSHGFAPLLAAMEDLRKSGNICRLLFLTADAETIIKRYKETRRRHPLMEDGETTQEAPAVCNCTEKCVAGAVNTACPVCAVNMAGCTGQEPEPTPDPEAEAEPETEPAGLNPAFLLVVLAALGGIGALVYFKFIRQKPKTKGSDNLDDYDYGADEELPEDETWETEPEDADGGGDEESENPAK